MKTEMIKKEGSYSVTVTDALKARGYEVKETATKQKNGTTSTRTLVNLGDAPCRTFESHEDLQANLAKNLQVQYCTEKCHVLDKKKFESAVLEKEGLKEVSKSLDGSASAAAVRFWIEQDGKEDFSGVIKTKKSTMTFEETKQMMITALQSM